MAILAELVRPRASGAIGRVAGAQRAPTSEIHQALAPVRGMTVKVDSARHRSTDDGHTYYFCSAGCLASFEKDPAAYAGTE